MIRVCFSAVSAVVAGAVYVWEESIMILISKVVEICLQAIKGAIENGLIVYLADILF